MKPARRAPLADWATYRRLLAYLCGERRIVAAVFACIAVESVFTVLTISALKPILDLLGDEPILASVSSGPAAARPLDFAPLRRLPDGTRVVEAAGDASAAKSADRLRRRLLSALDGRSTEPLRLDLGAVRGLGDPAWFALAEAAAAARRSGTPLALALPPARPPPPSILAAALADVRLTTATALAATAKATAAPGAVASARRAALAALAPHVERLQTFAESSPANKFRALGVLVGTLLTAAACMVAAGFGVGYLSSYLATRVVQKVRDSLFSHMVGLDLAHFSAHTTGSQMSVVLQDVQAVDGAVDILFSSVFKTPVTLIVLVGAMLAISPRLTLFTFTILPLVGVLIYVLGRRVRRVASRIQQAKGILAGVLEETFSGMRIVKAYATEAREAERFAKENRRIFRLALKTTAAEEIGGGLTQLLGIATVGVMVLAGGYIVVVSRELAYSDFITFVALLTQVFRPLKGVSKTNAKLQRGLAGCDRVFAVLDAQPAVADRPGAAEPGPLRRGIELREVSFRYAPDRAPALDGVSLAVPAGRSVALVGHAGCGKSTLANLLPRFYDPTAGGVFWDGTDLRDLTLAGLRRQIALITQDVILFDGTAAANIAYGAPADTTRDAVVAAARAARAHDFILRMPQGYDTPVGGRGGRLSGGERQRLAIARAILKNAPLLILDEATSALDSETEALVQEALADLMKGRTTLVIAHRLSTIQSCDEICVMDAGRIVERGTHRDLLARPNGRYARFHALQFGTSSAIA